MLNLYQQYCEELFQTINCLKFADIDNIAKLLWAAYNRNNRIYVVGNGGSAATAAHYVCDLGKGTAIPGKNRIKIMSLTDNAAHLTAIANDLAYSAVFKEQLENLLEYQDILLCISASGNSSNLIQAVQYANSIGAIAIGILGFTGGKLKEITQANIVVDNCNYGQVEDIHLMIGHIISQYFKELMQDKVESW